MYALHIASCTALLCRVIFSSCLLSLLIVTSLQSQQVVVHSALLAAHSAFFAKKFEDSKHSQRLYSNDQQPLAVDTGTPGKRIQVNTPSPSHLLADTFGVIPPHSYQQSMTLLNIFLILRVCFLRIQ